MKAYLLSLSIGVLLLPFSTFAYIDDGQGGCSHHQGINCSLGADYDGSAICNDGWKDSTIKYSDVKICRNQQFYKV